MHTLGQFMYAAQAAATTFLGSRFSLTLIVLVVVVIVPMYVVAPLRMLAKPGQLRARFVPAIKDKDSDPGLWGFVEATRTALAREGFTPAPPGTPFTSTTNRTAVLQLFTHPKNGDVASVIAILKGAGQTHSVLGFTTNFADSTIFYTDNSRLPSPVPERPRRHRCRFPDERDPGRLYAVHRARVTAARKPQRPIQIEESIAYQLEREEEGRRWMVESGYYMLDGERLRTTWKGAFFGVWRFLPPWRTLESLKEELLRRTILSQPGLA
jgi:hypothetical protein